MPRLTDIEKLARDICWAETPRPVTITKAAFWRCVDPDKKARHLRDAEWLVFIVKKLKPIRILEMVDFRGSAPKRRSTPQVLDIGRRQ